MKLASLSVDLDEIDCYQHIYGLNAEQAPARGEGPVYARAVPRFQSLFASLGVPCTFFAIGHDLEGTAARALGELVAHGHEPANHTFSHLYDLTRRDADVMRSEVDRGADAIARACGRRPIGFRAPGYTVNDTLLAVLRAAGVEYDSSVFPCPPYWLAKATALGWIRLRGRVSHSVLDTPRVLTAPADPYVPASPYWEADRTASFSRAPFLELPIGVTRGPRLPFIGGPLMLAGPHGASALARMMDGRPHVNLELHGIDLLDAREDDLESLGAHQRDLRVPLARKLDTLRAVVHTLQHAGYRFVTLEQAAQSLRDDTA